MSRSINLADYPLRYQPVLNWIKANGLNPAKLPRDQVVEIDDGLLYFTEFVFTPDGNKKIHGANVVTQSCVTHLISSPAAHNLFS